MFTIILLLLLFDGYAAHNLYRDTYFLVGAMAASIKLLPMLQQEVTEIEPGQQGAATLAAPAAGEWSPALLPALRSQIPTEVPWRQEGIPR